MTVLLLILVAIRPSRGGRAAILPKNPRTAGLRGDPGPRPDRVQFQPHRQS